MRLIDADKAIGRYYAEWEKQDISDGAQDRDWLKQCIDEAPTIDAVPVVRRQECKHKNTTACPAYDAPFMRTSLRIKFCSEGKRKEGDHVRNN